MPTETWIVEIVFPANTRKGTAVAGTVQRSQFEPKLSGINVKGGKIRRIYTVSASSADAVLVISKGNQSISLNIPESALRVSQNTPAGFVDINLLGGFYTFSGVPTLDVGGSPITAVFYIEGDFY